VYGSDLAFAVLAPQASALGGMRGLHEPAACMHQMSRVGAHEITARDSDYNGRLGRVQTCEEVYSPWRFESA
jgi:hypothetical protein